MPTLTVRELFCKRCGHRWYPSSSKTPVVCPRCKSYKWNLSPIVKASLLLVLLWFVPSLSATTYGPASWYSTEACRVNPDPRCPTASGRSLYDLEARGILFAASWDYPFNTQLKVCRADRPTVCTTVVVLDRGPAKRLHRPVDLCKAAFRELVDLKRGVVDVTVEAMR